MYIYIYIYIHIQLLLLLLIIIVVIIIVIIIMILHRLADVEEARHERAPEGPRGVRAGLGGARERLGSGLLVAVFPGT